ncbi:MAG: galactokinase, partial [Anaerolineae bacterium]|nr:galactokinase [Anaerolineae bacterium]
MSIKDTVIERFKATFGEAPALLVRAPGRVNLIGEHTDYNDGFVLPAAIDRTFFIAARPRTDSTVTLVSVDFDATTTFTMNTLDDPDLPRWSTYPRGSLWWLREHGYTVPGGYAVPGMDAVIGGDIPVGAGLSSSAAV